MCYSLSTKIIVYIKRKNILLQKINLLGKGITQASSLKELSGITGEDYSSI